MSAFVTGGSGFIGAALVSRLVAEGTAVRALTRSAAAAGRLQSLGADPVAGDVADLPAMADGMRGCSVVYHVAGVNETCPRDPKPLYRVNVDGTRAVVAAAAAAGVPRVIMTSSAAAIGERAGEVAREGTAHSGSFLSHYAASKKLGEDAGFAEGDRTGVEVVAVNPSSVQGPGRTGGSARLLLGALDRRRPVVVDAVVSIVDVDDCVETHIRAAERGVAGRRYLVSGATATVTDILAMLSEASGLAVDPIVVPRLLASIVGRPLAAVVRAAAPGAGVCPALVATLLHGHRVDGSRAVAELGVRYTPLAETLRRTVAWYRTEGLLRSDGL